MRLSKNNIRFVKELTMDGMTYGWYVSLGNTVSDSRDYINYEEYERKGVKAFRTVCKEYGKDRLPSSVLRFINKHDRRVWTSETLKDGRNFVEYIYMSGKLDDRTEEK